MKTDVLLGIFSSIALSHVIFLCTSLFFTKKGDNKSNLLLSFFLLSITLRVGKSVYFATTSDMENWMPALGAICMAATGPLFYFYSLRLAGNWKVFKAKDLVHIVVPASLFYVFADAQQIENAYLLSMLSSCFYILLVLSGKANTHAIARDWIRVLGVFFVIILMIYFCQYLGMGVEGYVISAFFSAIFLWILSFFAMFKFSLLNKIHLYHLAVFENVSDADRQKMAHIKSILSKPENFKKSDFNIQELAELLECSTSKTSQLVQIAYQKSFSQILNEYRTSYAEQLLSSPAHRNQKIASLAYDSGFQSPSHFYAQFKKKHNKTPTEYRKTVSS